ncbi:uncharacterized protein LOC110919195 [Helianthus annuus]|uniref:uncharacterized protein LOC110919195 n=1 Tax=Helianthus annuus TaxID=4232 RepID=UPI000B8FAD77|nr:uncharacterized protein LOC110919195 [Helianthus annuus]
MSSIAREIQPMIESNPEMPIQAIQSQLLRKHQLLHKVFRAKRIATTRIYGDYQEQYGLLRSYCDELLKANPGSTIKIYVEPCGNPGTPTRQFRRIYACFASMMRGFKMIVRPLLGVDGCFVKGTFPGQILSVVGIDGNNSIYPVCYALVEAETTQSWKWFLQLLRDDLSCTIDSSFTFISDIQKGLIPAMLAVFPNAEHKFCLRHIHENMKSNWRGDVYKNLLWSAGRKTFIPYFNKAMEEIKTIERAIQIIGAKDKPIITCLEFIREYMTKRIVNVKKLQAKCMGPLTPHATEVFDGIKKQASEMSVLMVDTDKYQVAAIGDMSRNSIDAGMPEEWVSDVYSLSTWKKVYENVIEPINGPKMWTPSQCPTTLIPPKHHTHVGRPKKKRKKAFGEKELENEFDKGGKMTRKGTTNKCDKCGNLGHNIRSCKGQGGEKFAASQESHTATQGAPIDNRYD